MAGLIPPFFFLNWLRKFGTNTRSPVSDAHTHTQTVSQGFGNVFDGCAVFVRDAAFHCEKCVHGTVSVASLLVSLSDFPTEPNNKPETTKNA